MNCFEQKVFDTIIKYNMLKSGDSVLVGLSGGADSCSLAYVLNRLSLKLGINVVCAHLNHGIRGDEALRDMNFSEDFAKSLNLKFVSETVNVPEYAKINKLSEETAGRNLRYDFFRRVSKHYNCNKIAIAHNKNDRAETVIFNMIRGCGSNGFFGIKPVNETVIRPLIEVTRQEIEAYAKDNGINYVTDSTNKENIYSRNLIRNNVISELMKINPKAVDNIVRTSDIIYSENILGMKSIIEQCSLDVSDNTIKIKKNSFNKLDSSQKRQLILYSIKKICNSTENITFAQLDNVLSTHATGKHFKFGSDINLYYTSAEVVISSLDCCDIEYEYSVSSKGICNVKEANQYYKFEYVDTYKKDKNAVYISADNFELKQLTLRTRRDGDVFFPSGFKGSKKVKKFFVDNKISQYERHLYPLLVFNNEILAILPLRVSEKYRITDATEKILKITICGGTYDEK